MDKLNQDLDKLFREKLTSEKYAYPFSQNDWDTLEQKLNLNRKHQRNVFLSRSLIGSAAALLIFFLIWMMNTNKPIPLRSQITKSIEPPPDNSHITKDLEEETKNDGRTHTTENLAITRDLITRISHHVANVEERNRVYEDVRIYTLNKVTDSTNQSFRSLYLSPNIESKFLNNQFTNAAVELDQELFPNAGRPMNIVLSVFVAPALNAVNGFKHGEIGADLGVLLSVDLSKKLTVSTGAIYAKKVYETDFHRNIYPNIGKYQYNDAAIFPQSVYADCKVLDIPVNINYSLIDKGKNKVSMGAGMSSYIMLKEQYQFEYADQDYINSENVELVNENAHIMSVLNLQASYTRQLNSKIGASLQPYLKIPLNDIGFAHTRLQSAGIAVNVNFNLNSKK